MIILKANFDPITKSHIRFAKENHVEGFYIKHPSIHKEKMVKMFIKGYDRYKLVDEIHEDDIVLKFDEKKSRNAIEAGDFSDLLKPTKAYILENGLYLDEIMNHYNHGHRAKHVLSMTKFALEIAKWHHVDQNKVLVCAMIHDIYKQIDKDEAYDLMDTYFKEHVNEPAALYHQYLGAYFLEHHMLVKDKDMINAIKYHTTGVSLNKLAMIIFIADKLDPGRGYDITRQREVVKKNLKEGFELVKREQEYYITHVEGKQIGTVTDNL